MEKLDVNSLYWSTWHKSIIWTLIYKIKLFKILNAWCVPACHRNIELKIHFGKSIHSNPWNAGKQELKIGFTFYKRWHTCRKIPGTIHLDCEHWLVNSFISYIKHYGISFKSKIRGAHNTIWSHADQWPNITQVLHGSVHCGFHCCSKPDLTYPTEKRIKAIHSKADFNTHALFIWIRMVINLKFIICKNLALGLGRTKCYRYNVLSLKW